MELELERFTEPIIGAHRKRVEALLPESAGAGKELLLTACSPFESLRTVVNERSATWW
jgi:hypothetical protein